MKTETSDLRLIEQLRRLANEAQRRATLLADESVALFEKAHSMNWAADQLERALLLS